jgi:hypothetical protein
MSREPTTSLTEELSIYDSNKMKWLESYEGQFVLIQHETVVGFFPTFEKAFESGVRQFGISTDFLVKQVAEHDPVFVIY